jgi:peptide deformylase
MDTTAGTARPITFYGQAVLHRPCAPVTSFDAALAALVEDMFASMYAAEGVGLAANQIGVRLRVFVYDCPDASGDRQCGHVVNPVLRIPAVLAAPQTELEGCLSVPGQHAEVTRPGLATVTGADVFGRPVTVTGTGTLARCLQHECDHLDGIVYVDRLPAAERAAILVAAGLPSGRQSPLPPSAVHQLVQGLAGNRPRGRPHPDRLFRSKRQGAMSPPVSARAAAKRRVTSAQLATFHQAFT